MIAVIELKSTKTRSMDRIVDQAFAYKHNHPNCRYVITSNFAKLRLYVEYSDHYEVFDLFDLDEERFTLLYALLAKENLFADVPLQLKKASKLQEEEISAALYKKYAKLRTDLFENIPIPAHTPQEQQEALSHSVKSLIALKQEQKSKVHTFLKRLSDNLSLEKPSKKIEAFCEHDFKTLLKELKKKKITLSLTQQDEWEAYFNDYKDTLTALQAEIDNTDKEIDQTVYELYGLTDEEIAVVEGRG